MTIQEFIAQYFPMFAFSSINTDIESSERLKSQQVTNITECINTIPLNCQVIHTNIQDVLDDENIPSSYKNNSIIWNTSNDYIPLEEIENYLRNTLANNDTNYRKLLSVYDYKKYNII